MEYGELGIHKLLHRNAHTGNGSIDERNGPEIDAQTWKAPVFAKSLMGLADPLNHCDRISEQKRGRDKSIGAITGPGSESVAVRPGIQDRKRPCRQSAGGTCPW